MHRPHAADSTSSPCPRAARYEAKLEWAYNLEHPTPEPKPEVPRPEPTRIQPGRTGVRRAADVALTYACMLCERKAVALQALAPDPLPGVGVP